MQRALTVAGNEEGLKLVAAIRPHLHSMQASTPTFILFLVYKSPISSAIFRCQRAMILLMRATILVLVLRFDRKQLTVNRFRCLMYLLSSYVRLPSPKQSTSSGRRIAAKIIKRYPTVDLGEEILMLMSRG